MFYFAYITMLPPMFFGEVLPALDNSKYVRGILSQFVSLKLYLTNFMSFFFDNFVPTFRIWGDFLGESPQSPMAMKLDFRATKRPCNLF